MRAQARWACRNGSISLSCQCPVQTPAGTWQAACCGEEPRARPRLFVPEKRPARPAGPTFFQGCWGARVRTVTLLPFASSVNATYGCPVVGWVARLMYDACARAGSSCRHVCGTPCLWHVSVIHRHLGTLAHQLKPRPCDQVIPQRWPVRAGQHASARPTRLPTRSACMHVFDNLPAQQRSWRPQTASGLASQETPGALAGEGASARWCVSWRRSADAPAGPASKSPAAGRSGSGAVARVHDRGTDSSGTGPAQARNC